IESDIPIVAVVHDLHVESDGSVVAVGGTNSDAFAFAVRLLGNAGGDAPGVVGFVKAEYEADSEGGDIVMTLRRSGGSAGPVSVAYELGSEGWDTASAGVDYDFDSGTLAWENGDTSVREIRIPVHVDDAVEEPEYFGVQLGDVQGGAGLGAFTAVGAIPADGKPFGQFSLGTDTYLGTEGAAAVIEVVRNYYDSGAVSVTLTPRAGTAEAGTDFDARPVTLSWADGEWGWKSASIPIIDDTDEEPVELFTVELTNAAGGALIAAPATATVRLGMSDLSPTAPSVNGGGGAFGVLSMLLLGIGPLLRRLLCLRPAYRSLD
ncbi:MAG TPA: Calx-beta domain-containing protein, partial [Woeseiaceae bacterium]|nr:Calx-beta domain-containing protein [Woeseiaceae bacterium]